MPRGPKGEKRLADVVGNAVLVMKIATGELDDPKSSRDAALSDRGKKALQCSPLSATRFGQ